MLGPMRFFAVFAMVALAEMATFFWVESKIGLIWALGLALVTALVGSFLVRRAGLSVISRLQTKVGQGQLPGRELSDGAAILVSGAFLISPGFITDVLGFLLLVPPVRYVVYRMVSKRLSARMTVFAVNRRTTHGDSPGAGESADGLRDDVIDIDGWE